MGQEARIKVKKQEVKILYGITNWFKIEKGVQQDCLLSPVCLIYALSTSSEMPGWMNYKLESRQAGKHLRYVDDTTVMAESEEELKSLLMRMKEESERAGLKLNSKKKLRS